LTGPPDTDLNQSCILTSEGDEEIPMERASIYFGIPIGFNKYGNSKHGYDVLASMLEEARTIGQSKLPITQKMDAFESIIE
jgi:hypothetical protein